MIAGRRFCWNVVHIKNIHTIQVRLPGASMKPEKKGSPLVSCHLEIFKRYRGCGVMNTTSQGRRETRVRVGVVQSTWGDGMSCTITMKDLTRGMYSLGEKRQQMVQDPIRIVHHRFDLEASNPSLVLHPIISTTCWSRECPADLVDAQILPPAWHS